MRNMREGGGRPNELGQDELAESDCWALRLRRVYGSWPDGHHPACAHAGPDSSAHYCIPLFSLDRNVGLITVSLPHVGEDAFQVQSRDARLSQFVAMAQSISGALSTIALRESLQRMALTDELTGLKNRRSFQTDVARMLSTCKRKHRAFGLALLDIDHFKNVNDEHGHDVGDRVLRQVAQVMLQSLREGDLVARVGGEEFAIFMEEVDEAVATRRLQDLLNNIRASCLVGGKPITASVGLAHSEAYAQCMEFDELYRDADTALYRAKDTGRDRLEHKPRVQPPQPASVE